MNRATPELRRLAEDLVSFETSLHKSPEAIGSAVFYVFEKLRSSLANLMGLGGLRALLSRALVLATAEVSWLSAVHVTADGTLEGWQAPDVRLDPAEFREGSTFLLAHLLEVLVALIGPNLTSRLVGEMWPDFHSASWD